MAGMMRMEMIAMHSSSTTEDHKMQMCHYTKPRSAREDPAVEMLEEWGCLQATRLKDLQEFQKVLKLIPCNTD